MSYDSSGPSVNPGEVVSREGTTLDVSSKVLRDLPGSPGQWGCTLAPSSQGVLGSGDAHWPLSRRGQSALAEDMTSGRGKDRPVGRQSQEAAGCVWLCPQPLLIVGESPGKPIGSLGPGLASLQHFK